MPAFARLGSLALVLAMSLAAVAQAQEKATLERTLTVSASGESAAMPDIATISSGVVTEGEIARETLARNSATMAKVIEGLKAAGIEPRDIRTSQINVQPRYVSVTKSGADGTNRITGYIVSNQVRVKVHGIARLGEILDQIVTLGANQIGGISFEVSKADALLDEARNAAVANARRRAELFATAAGARLGNVISLTEEGESGAYQAVAGFGAARAAMAVPVEAGSQTLQARVRVVFELKP